MQFVGSFTNLFLNPCPPENSMFSNFANFLVTVDFLSLMHGLHCNCVHQNSWLTRSLYSILGSENRLLFCVLSLLGPDKHTQFVGWPSGRRWGFAHGYSVWSEPLGLT
jgi:hypothetical protein